MTLSVIDEQKFKDTKRIIRISKSKDRQHMEKRKRTYNDDLQNIARKTKDRVTRTPLITGTELECSGRVGSPEGHSRHVSWALEFLWGACCSIFSFMCNVLKIGVCHFSFGPFIVCFFHLRLLITSLLSSNFSSLI